MKILLVVLGLAFALPTFAFDGVYCISGCEQAQKKAKSPALYGEVPDTQLTSTLWVGPSIGILPYVYDAGTKTWAKQISPAFAYGLKWRPPGWTATKSLVSLDLFASADLGDLSHIDAVPTVTLLDAVTVGFGPRFKFATPTSGGSVTGLFAIGFSTSFGGP